MDFGLIFWFIAPSSLVLLLYVLLGNRKGAGAKVDLASATASPAAAGPVIVGIYRPCGTVPVKYRRRPGLTAAAERP